MNGSPGKRVQLPRRSAEEQAAKQREYDGLIDFFAGFLGKPKESVEVQSRAKKRVQEIIEEEKREKREAQKKRKPTMGAADMQYGHTQPDSHWDPNDYPWGQVQGGAKKKRRRKYKTRRNSKRSKTTRHRKRTKTKRSKTKRINKRRRR